MSAKYKSSRKAIPVRTEEAVLAKSRRRCTLCFGLHGDRKEKLGQIAHLDRNRSNNAESNLAWMCLDHHSLFDSTTKQHKNYTIPEVKEYRRRLYKVLHSAPQRSSRRVRRSSASKPKTAERSAKATNSPVASGANISQPINSPTVNLSLPAPTSGTLGRERYDEWRELEQLAGQLVEELASYRPLDQSMVAPKMVEYRQAAGRFARYDNVRRAILQLQNSLDRMFAAKRDRNDDEENLRSELDRDLKKLLSVSDQVTERD